MRTNDIVTTYGVNDIVRVVDNNSPFYNMSGTIARIGMANPFVLLHVVFPSYGVSPMTVYEKQVELEEKGMKPLEPSKEPVRVEPGIDEEFTVNTPTDNFSDTTPTAVPPPIEKRKRGRPKGSKNKPKN